ncbi:hypothetical protein WJX72_000929 [[Myrmecia] bisecta]|uniref:Dihydroorotate dehydrogenase (quinone), mitochondrial n=1 Tax=[Myrmecia] bisecta TaxID=41462 RepID=A0AAW1P6Z3_9CHLO
MLRTLGRRLLLLGSVGTGAVLANYYDRLDELQYDAASLASPVLRLLDAETSHNVAVWSAAHGLVPRDHKPDPPSLRTMVWGREFRNPIGLAAGFDKDAQAVEGLLGIGFGFVEVGSVTPLPQPGNPQPRVFRLPELKATINRYGFNSQGVDAVASHLAAYRARLDDNPARERGLLGVNLGKNKTSEDAAADYCIGVSKLGQYADYLVINVSSPNTPGLRSLQGRKELEHLVKRVKTMRDSTPWGSRGPPPLLVKIAPDLTEADKSDIAAVALKHNLDGLIVSNTTIARPPEVHDYPCGQEAGGLSGKPLFEPSTKVLSDMYKLTKGKLPIIGCGGVSSGEDAYKKIRAGASLVQLYTGMAYEGPALVPRIKRELAECLARDGLVSVQQAVGADHEGPSQRKASAWRFYWS